jgi:hypothetical protein
VEAATKRWTLILAVVLVLYAALFAAHQAGVQVLPW